jgi:hypothetical protein
MISLERRLPTVMEADLPRLTDAVGIMIAAAVAPSAQRVTDPTRQIDVGRKERVRQAVRRHLRTPTLTPKTLSRLVGISRSNPYRLFEHEGAVAHYEASAPASQKKHGALALFAVLANYQPSRSLGVA